VPVCCEHFLYLVVEFFGYERLVTAGMFDAVVCDVAEVVAVSEDFPDGADRDRGTGRNVSSWAGCAILAR
jgi:hypothetical protein